MAMAMEVAGTKYTMFLSCEVERSLDTISGIFKFTAATEYGNSFPIPRGEAVQITVNDTPVLTGYVDKIKVTYSATSHEIEIEGRDKTCDIVDSHIDHKLEFKAPITLDEVIKKTLENIHLSDVEVINKVDDLKPFKKEELISGKIGEKAFEFMDKYAVKRQVVLTTDGLGNVVITRASEESTGWTLKNVVEDPFNTIKTAEVEYDDSQRFHTYKFVTQANHSAEPKHKDHPKKSTNRTATYEDDEIRESRTFVALQEGNTKEEPIKDRAKWEANIRRAKSFKYKCLHVGHSPESWDGEPYQPNTLFEVQDDFADVDEELLAVKVIHKESVQDGSTTEIELLTREAFMLLLAEKNKGKDKDKKGKGKGKKKGTGDSKYTKFDNSASRYSTDGKN